MDGMIAAETATKRPKSNASATYAADGPCPWCGDWPDDKGPTSLYCRRCDAERKAVERRRRRAARLSAWYAEFGTADAERAAMLASAIVTELGGYDRAAKQLVAWLRDLVESKRAPKQAMVALRGLMDMIRLSLPPEEPAHKKSP